jgi:hypothetical protein
VAAHNRFAFEHGGRVFSRTAPVLRLSPGADEDEYIALLGVLNSSTVCFWLKQTGAATPFDGPGVASPGEEWARPYRFATGPLTRLPLPADAPIVRARELHALARLLETYEPSTVCAREQPPSRSALDAARAVQEETGRQMVSLQEELDWEVYGSYGLLADDERARLTTPADVPPPPLRRGERAFEIVLARRIEVGEDSDSWFVRHAATPITEIPQHWPSAYKNVVRARIEAIESRHPIAVVERPEYKRRWLSESWGRREREALRTWLLDRCEDERLWFERGNGDRHPRPRTIGQLAGDLGADTAVRSVAALYSFRHLGRRHATLRDVLAEILTDEHVPYVSALRYKESGLRKRAQWEQVWQLQRSEDRTGEAMGIPVPPKFSAADFRHTSYWSLRGSLDIPRERFVSYPGAVAGVDSLLIGWSGWSDTDRLLVLLDLVGVLQQQPQPGVDQVAPLLAAIQELIPWVRQWGALKEPGPNLVQAETYQRDLDDLRTDFGLSTHDLTSWRPRKATSKEN